MGRHRVAERRRHGERPAGDHRLAQVAALGQSGAGQHHQRRHQHADGGKHADLEGARAQLALVDDTEGDEGAGAQAGEPVGEEEEPATPVDADADLRAMAANRLRDWARRPGWEHTRISRRSRRPIERAGDEPVKGPAA